MLIGKFSKILKLLLGIFTCMRTHWLYRVAKWENPKKQSKSNTSIGGGDIKYWRDTEGVHHVPKRKLEDLIVMRMI